MTYAEVFELVVLLLVDVCHSLVILLGHLGHTLLQWQKLCAAPVFCANVCWSLACLEHIGYDLSVEAVCNVTSGCHGLKLCRALVDCEDAGVTVKTLAGVLEHEA